MSIAKQVIFVTFPIRQVNPVDLFPQVVQPVLDGLAAALDCYVEVTSSDGVLLAASGTKTDTAIINERILSVDGIQFGMVRVASLRRTPALAELISTAIASVAEQANRFMVRYTERLNVSSWAQLLTSSFAQSDETLEHTAGTLGIRTDVRRAIFLIRALPARDLEFHPREEGGGWIAPATRTLQAENETLWETLHSNLPNNTMLAELSPHVFFAAVPTDGLNEDETGQRVLQRLRAAGFITKVGIGSRAEGIEGYRESYELARQTLQLQDRLSRNEPLLYSDWGVLRLIESVPRMVRAEFLSTYASRFASLDIELVKTLRAFLDHDLSMKRTSEFLHVHRNTLIYRLAQIEAATELDPRRFEHAVLIRVLLWCHDLA